MQRTASTKYAVLEPDQRYRSGSPDARTIEQAAGNARRDAFTWDSNEVGPFVEVCLKKRILAEA
jgi:hypothetical protein